MSVNSASGASGTPSGTQDVNVVEVGGTPVSSPLPVDTGLTQPTTPADTQPVSGSVAVSNMIPAVETGLAKDTTVVATNTSLGTDGATPPSIAGTGVRGWLRAIYDRLVAGIGRTWTLSSGTDSVTVVGGVSISGEVEVSNDSGNPLPISAASLPLPTGAATAANQQTNALTDTQLRASAVPISGTVTANQGTAGATQWLVKDDCTDMEAQTVTLTGSTDTTVTFAQSVRLVHIKNFDTANRVKVKNGAIASDSDTSATWVSAAPTANVAAGDWFPFRTSTIHLRSAGASELSVEGFF